MRLTKPLIFMFVLFLAPALYAQPAPGHLVTVDKDTLTGYIQFSKKDEFQSVTYKDKSRASIQHLPSRVMSFTLKNGSTYVSGARLAFGKDDLFYEHLSTGLIDVFHTKEEEKDVYYLYASNSNFLRLEEYEQWVYDDGHPRKINIPLYKGQLKSFFAEYPEMHADIDKANLNHTSILRLSKKFSQLQTAKSPLDSTGSLRTEQFQVFNKYYDLPKFSWGPKVILGFGTGKYPYYQRDKQNPELTSSVVEIGATGHYLLSPKSNKLSLLTGFQLASFGLQGTSFGYNNYYFNSSRLVALGVPIGAVINFTDQQVNLYISFGLHTNITLWQDGKITAKGERFYENTVFSYNTNLSGSFIEAGISIRNKQGHRFNISGGFKSWTGAILSNAMGGSIPFYVATKTVTLSYFLYK